MKSNTKHWGWGTATLLALGVLTIGMSSVVEANPLSAISVEQSKGGNKGNGDTPFNPPGRGRPPRTWDGGSRPASSCVSATGNKSLMTLEPHQDLALTMEAHPTLYWYIPETTAKTVEVTLMDETDENIIYQGKLAAPEQAGIMSWRIPQKEEFALKEGKKYHWYVALVCDENDPTRSGDIITDGWLERLSSEDPLAQGITGQGLKDSRAYAQVGIWQDALNQLAQERRANPGNKSIARQWKGLLNAVDLGEYASAPFVETQAIE